VTFNSKPDRDRGAITARPDGRAGPGRLRSRLTARDEDTRVRSDPSISRSTLRRFGRNDTQCPPGYSRPDRSSRTNSRIASGTAFADGAIRSDNIVWDYV